MVFHVRLKSEDDDGPDVLENQNADGEPTVRPFAVALRLEELDDDHRGRQGTSRTQIESSIFAYPEEANTVQAREYAVHANAADGELQKARDDRDSVHEKKLLDVKLQANHEEAEDKTKGADVIYRMPILHDMEADRAHKHTTDEIAEDQWLLDHVCQECGEAASRHDEGDVNEHGRGPSTQAPVMCALLAHSGRIPGGRRA
mmetsp:Transcript_101161/g.216667  ORF Transcript_101161/g.216667 Transcript_101161/m.216667 type:complete len:202 (+) Transcript_101161:1379-1984(+)